MASSELVDLALAVVDVDGPPANVLVGPVIGLVSDCTARILLEVDADTTVVIVLDPSDALKETVRQQLKFTREIPLAFNLTGCAVLHLCSPYTSDNRTPHTLW